MRTMWLPFPVVVPCSPMAASSPISLYPVKTSLALWLQVSTPTASSFQPIPTIVAFPVLLSRGLWPKARTWLWGSIQARAWPRHSLQEELKRSGSTFCRDDTPPEPRGVQRSIPMSLCFVLSFLLQPSLSVAPVVFGQVFLSKLVSVGSPYPRIPTSRTSLVALACLSLMTPSPCPAAPTGCFTPLKRFQQHPVLPLSLLRARPRRQFQSRWFWHGLTLPALQHRRGSW